MASLSKPPLLVHNHLTSSSHALIGPATLSFSKTTSLLRARLCALKTGAGRQESDGPELLRKPVVKDLDGNSEEDEGEDGKWVDWEDKILEDTVPLVGFVRMILHSGKYESGDRLSPEHQKTVLERLLPFHPEAAKKIGCGIDYVTVGYHPDFESSRCLFIVQKDGTLVDFSYWKCIKGLIRKNYPLYADSFILRHFRKRRRGGA
ncbi:PREDICTED: protein DCL, chloroplastic [Fragaria vesca subsp. vesca]|uniref:protein DCL, chloroplastic n=1 Tax=Fragaria vesca subsp. vesca TaxID=101020 RepID=UPI0002C2E417|nr:PREDICTED: protein DCL, chloroplastic [Fragaria vesca subsp. vesca]